MAGGRKEQALQTAAPDERMVMVNVDPKLSTLRSDALFVDLLEDLGLARSPPSSGGLARLDGSVSVLVAVRHWAVLHSLPWHRLAEGQQGLSIRSACGPLLRGIASRTSVAARCTIRILPDLLSGKSNASYS